MQQDLEVGKPESNITSAIQNKSESCTPNPKHASYKPEKPEFCPKVHDEWQVLVQHCRYAWNYLSGQHQPTEHTFWFRVYL